jgi:LysM repeat protein
MKDDPKLQTDDSWSDNTPYSPKRRRLGSANSKSLRTPLVILLVLVFVGGIVYFLYRQPTGGEASPLESKVAALEQKLAGLEKQITDLQGKTSVPGPDPAFFQRVEALSQRIAALEKRTQPAVESKAKPSPPPKPAVESKAKPSSPPQPAASSEKQYHTVQKGETLYRISKKYDISVEELQKLNNLSPGQALHTGQKLQVSPRR